MAAAECGDCKAIEKLVGAGADINCSDESGNTPLHFAAYNGKKDATSALLRLGAVLSTQGTSGNTPLHFAARAGHAACCKVLVDAGADVNALCDGNYTPLHLACMSGELDACKQLLESGAFVNATNANRASPLHYAASLNRPDIAAALLGAHADLTLVDCRGDSPPEMAARLGNEDVLAVFKQNPSAPAIRKRKTHSGRLVLEIAGQSNMFEPAGYDAPSSFIEAAKELASTMCSEIVKSAGDVIREDHFLLAFTSMYTRVLDAWYRSTGDSDLGDSLRKQSSPPVLACDGIGNKPQELSQYVGQLRGNIESLLMMYLLRYGTEVEARMTDFRVEFREALVSLACVTHFNARKRFPKRR